MAMGGDEEEKYGKEADMLEQKIGEKSEKCSGRLGHNMKRKQHNKRLKSQHTLIQTDTETE